MIVYQTIVKSKWLLSKESSKKKYLDLDTNLNDYVGKNNQI